MTTRSIGRAPFVYIYICHLSSSTTSALMGSSHAGDFQARLVPGASAIARREPNATEAVGNAARFISLHSHFFVVADTLYYTRVLEGTTEHYRRCRMTQTSLIFCVVFSVDIDINRSLLVSFKSLSFTPKNLWWRHWFRHKCDPFVQSSPSVSSQSRRNELRY